jgi:beta-glucosidase
MKRFSGFTILVLFSALTVVLAGCAKPETQAGYPAITTPEVERTIDSIISILSLEEKTGMLCGNGLFSSPGIERLGIRDIQYTDGPFGIREELGKRSWSPKGLTTDSATFFPTGSALAATWNPELAWMYGAGMGEEARTRGKDILLAPAVNITRSPLNGRTYEYYSEDPLLNSILSVNYVKGVQSTGVAACVKHYALNNQETNRGDINIEADERTLHEIYLPAFKAAVTEGGAYSVMAAYNKFRGQWCSENDYLLNTILREEWKFQGMVISDWGGTHSTVKAALNGLDVEMGTDRFFNKNLIDSVKQGLIPESVIDDKVRRILRVYFFVSKKAPGDSTAVVSTPNHNQTAYDIASQSIVLLKNTKKILPLNPKRIKSIAVIGENAIAKHAQGGFGAGVKARYETTPFEGLKNNLANKAEIRFARGYQSKYVEGRRFVPDNTTDKELIAEAAALASKSDVAIIFAGTNREVETESFDRTELTLPFGQDELIREVCKANRNTIVVIVAGAPVDLRTADSCSEAIIWSWFNGSQAGNAVADILLGNVTPSGKLPFTIPVKISDSPAHEKGSFTVNKNSEYAEGILVGYRWFDKKEISPMYPFGFGLSYTSFEFTDMLVEKNKHGKSDHIKITVKLKNTGIYDGMETIQIYAGETDAEVLKPVRELKAFRKIFLKAGEESSVNFDLPVNDLAWYDEKNSKWIVSSGNYRIAAGTSSRDIRKITDIEIK